jgi:hypothetical protein
MADEFGQRALESGQLSAGITAVKEIESESKCLTEGSAELAQLGRLKSLIKLSGPAEKTPRKPISSVAE